MLPKEKQTLFRYVRLLQPTIRDDSKAAAKLMETVLHLWQRIKFSSLVKGGPKPDRLLLKDECVIEFAEWLAACEFFDAAFWLSSAYAYWVGKDKQSSQSLYFTPPQLANRLIDNLVENGASLTNHIWVDPACGGAAFLAPVAKRMAEALRLKGFPSSKVVIHISNHLLGNDIDPTLANMSMQLLRMALNDEMLNARNEPVFRVCATDGLSGLEPLLGKVDVVICNPPYRKMKSGEVEKYKTSFNDVIQGQPNIYGLFFNQAIRLLKKGGTAGLLTPTSFLSGKDFSKLRTFLLTHADTTQLDIVQNREEVFIGVQQETAISILKRRSPGKYAFAETKVFTFEKVHGFQNIGRCLLPNSGLAWPVPRDRGDADLIRTLHGTTCKLKDYGFVARIGAFVDYRDERPTYKSEKAGRHAKALFPLLRSTDITQAGTFHHGRSRANSRNDTQLDTFIDMGTVRHMSVIRRPCVVLQRVTSTDQSRRLVAAPIDQSLLDRFGGVVGENHVVFLEQVDSSPLFSVHELSALLRSHPVDRLFRCISGAVNVSVFELNQLPLPEPQSLRRALTRFDDFDEAVKVAYSVHQN